MNGQFTFEVLFEFGISKPIVVVPSVAQISSDGGLLPFRQMDERIVLTQQFAAALTDPRHVGYVPPVEEKERNLLRNAIRGRCAPVSPIALRTRGRLRRH